MRIISKNWRASSAVHQQEASGPMHSILNYSTVYVPSLLSVCCLDFSWLMDMNKINWINTVAL